MKLRALTPVIDFFQQEFYTGSAWVVGSQEQAMRKNK